MQLYYTNSPRKITLTYIQYIWEKTTINHDVDQLNRKNVWYAVIKKKIKLDEHMRCEYKLKSQVTVNEFI